MKKIFNVVLGVVTSIGGFVEVGSISTAAQAGAEFGFALLWAIAAAALMVAIVAIVYLGVLPTRVLDFAAESIATIF